MPERERRNWIVVGFEDPSGDGFSPSDVSEVFECVMAGIEARGMSARARVAFAQRNKPMPPPVIVITADGVPVAVVSESMRAVLEPMIRAQIDKEPGPTIKEWGSRLFTVDDSGDDDDV